MDICGYSFGQDVRLLPSVSEADPWLYSFFRKTYSDEHLYKAPDVYFADRHWDVLIGTRGTAIYKITLQYLTSEPLEAALVFINSEAALNADFGKGEESGPNGQRFWKVPTGDIVLEAGIESGETRFVDLFATRHEWEGFCYYECPQCQQQIRVPAGRGDIRIRCPKCSSTFFRET